MNDKSFVTIAQTVCAVCGKKEDNGELLLDKRLRNRFDRHTTVEVGLCEEHKKLHEDGFVALVEVDNEPPAGQKTMKPDQAHRTGRIAHLKREVYSKVFDHELPIDPETGEPYVLQYVGAGVVDALQRATRAD